MLIKLKPRNSLDIVHQDIRTVDRVSSIDVAEVREYRRTNNATDME